ncbi:hypothetical protein LLG34_05290, partial [bacterium]|nr:hypothetical protein [bacterium]
MMYRPSLKSNRSMIILLCLAIVLFYIAQTCYIQVKTDNYEVKIAAAQLMKTAIDTLSTELHKRNIEIDPIDDPLKTG